MSQCFERTRLGLATTLAACLLAPASALAQAEQPQPPAAAGTAGITETLGSASRLAEGAVSTVRDTASALELPSAAPQPVPLPVPVSPKTGRIANPPFEPALGSSPDPPTYIGLLRSKPSARSHARREAVSSKTAAGVPRARAVREHAGQSASARARGPASTSRVCPCPKENGAHRALPPPLWPVATADPLPLWGWLLVVLGGVFLSSGMTLRRTAV
jgi:hypothetical protein